MAKVTHIHAKVNIDYAGELESATAYFEQGEFEKCLEVLKRIDTYVQINANAAYLLYTLLWKEGIGDAYGPEDRSIALENAAILGHPLAAREIAYWAEYGTDPSGHIPQNKAIAYAWYKKAKDAGENVSDSLNDLSLTMTWEEKRQAHQYQKTLCC